MLSMKNFGGKTMSEAMPDEKETTRQKDLILNRASNNKHRAECPISGPSCNCQGWIDTKQLHGLCSQYQRRMKDLRDDEGYLTPKELMPGRKGLNRQYWYHFIPGDKVDLFTILKPPKEHFRGKCELGGNVMEFYEVRKAA